MCTLSLDLPLDLYWMNHSSNCIVIHFSIMLYKKFVLLDLYSYASWPFECHANHIDTDCCWFKLFCTNHVYHILVFELSIVFFQFHQLNLIIILVGFFLSYVRPIVCAVLYHWFGIWCRGLVSDIQSPKLMDQWKR